jgi:MSHA pilin protein MshA
MKQVLSENKQAGFTLVELIVVIVILGILAATALPKFINVTENANMSAANGMAGALRSAVSLVQARAMAEGDTAAGTVTMAPSGTVTTTANLFPTADAAGIVAAMQSTEGFTVSHASGVSTFALTNTLACLVTYTESTGAVSTTAVTTTNC